MREIPLELDMIKHLYLNRRLGCRDIGLHMGVCSSTIHLRLKRMGITRSIAESAQVRRERCRLNGLHYHNWRGGRYKCRDSGYMYVYLAPDSLFYPMATANGYVREHRLVMAQHLSRCLERWEVVHHINGVKDDNRLENLTLLNSCIEHLHSTKLQQEVKRLRERVKQLQKELAKYKKVATS